MPTMSAGLPGKAVVAEVAGDWGALLAEEFRGKKNGSGWLL